MRPNRLAKYCSKEAALYSTEGLELVHNGVPLPRDRTVEDIGLFLMPHTKVAVRLVGVVSLYLFIQTEDCKASNMVSRHRQRDKQVPPRRLHKHPTAALVRVSRPGKMQRMRLCWNGAFYTLVTLSTPQPPRRICRRCSEKEAIIVLAFHGRRVIYSWLAILF